MPPHFVPARSGVHRIACLALYRSLVRRSSQLQIGEHQQYALRQLVKNVFLKNRKFQSPSKIVEALNLGYQSLETLQHVSSKPVQLVAKLVDSLTGPNALCKEENPKCGHKYRPSGEATKSRKTTSFAPIVWPRPDTPLVLSRPFQSTSGKRHIPKLVNTNGIPHLRFKKPQSPFLSRVIRDKIRQREKRFDRLQLLKAEIPMARAEDEWDSILKQTCGIDDDSSVLWIRAPVSALQEVRAKIQASHSKNTMLGRQMYKIVEMEKALAEIEQGNVGSGNMPGFVDHEALSAGCVRQSKVL
ncbi:hypothetical protein MMC26_005602 [Xylographa opegraphella]|nr:hypothetical protein [Xylographa opegraphella]